MESVSLQFHYRDRRTNGNVCRKERSFRPSVNPYCKKVLEHPGRIFCFDDFESDVARLRERCEQAEEVYCEIGSGSGCHAIEFAKQNPRALIIGFELRFKRCVRTIEKAEQAGVENVIVCRLDARFLTDIFAPRSLDGAFVYFPDPWSKRRTQKNRLLDREFLTAIEPLLADDGSLSMKTDNADYFAAFLKELSFVSKLRLVAKTENLYQSAFLEQNIQTEFERLFVGQGLAICGARCARAVG